ncbi:hypothetical protein RKLH11_3736 [Rhodobacteraceae bacterium KLH11]|nr:hypothetical protein RKLH11_3736 [Rhodobacteraceae bacterium KLH11]
MQQGVRCTHPDDVVIGKTGHPVLNHTGPVSAVAPALGTN